MLRCLLSTERIMRCPRLLLTVLLIFRSIEGRENGDRTRPRSRSPRAADDNCNWNLTVKGGGGTLTSPDYPQNYPSNADCRWLLTASDPNATLFLRIDSLQVEPDTDCKLDYLQVYQGASTLAPALGPFCGMIHDRVIKTNSSQLLLVFHSDPIYEDKGFSIDYFTQTPGDCPSLLTAGSGSLRSPGFPDNYPDNTDCWTQITTSQDKKIILFFESIDLEYGFNCTFDYVQIYDGATRNSSRLGQICQKSGDMSFESSSHSLLVHFHSDDSVNKRGYRARFSAIDIKSTPIGNCLWETGDDKNGTIASPNYPANYPSSANCSILIQAPDGLRIFITFDALQLEMESNCSYDYLKIKEGSSTDEVVLGTFCGRGSEPKNLTSTKNEVQVQFITDDFGEFSGFKLRYWFLKNETEEVETEKTMENEYDFSELTFNQTPENATLTVGSSYMLHCSTHHPNAKIRWLKGEQFLAGGTPLPGLKVLANGTLWIQSMDHHLSGIYSCVAVAPEATLTAKAYILIRNGPDDAACEIVFRITPKDSSFAEGELAHLECVASGSHIQMSWEKDGQPLVSNKHITVLKNGYVFLDRVKLEDSGVYSCIARDLSAGCIKKSSALLQVSERAKIEEICGKPKMGQPSKAVPQMEHGKILGGHNANKGAYPWQVMLWEPTLKSFCGGSLLNERWLATAAHCFVNFRNLRWDRIVIKLGKYDREHEEEQEFRTGIADPSSIVVHPAYNKVTFDNDLALIRLRDHVRFSDYILPVCLGDRDLGESFLSQNESNSKIKMGAVIGWGKLKEHGPSPRFLQEIKLPIVNQNTCLASTNYTVSRNMFCAGYSQEILGDACHGDSGGPYLMSHRDRWYLVGIVSWGEGCGMANKYGFYTRLPNYLSWIKGIIKS